MRFGGLPLNIEKSSYTSYGLIGRGTVGAAVSLFFLFFFFFGGNSADA